ncbi:universal stress protein [Gandjariella thermophila]|uniref:Universal stress protein n=1 Tax=Gandjariella thermophila TaxID=1931992 RepID=A0A4D4JJ28_9PSEU|nr:universal stress protein [Gandjariella thermophila]GDY33907.1 universal stress protein [Gandjariella thermophila]
MTSNLAGSPIAVGIDGSRSALRAAAWAADEAARRNVPLRLLHAVMVPTFAYAGGIAPPDSFFAELDDAGRGYLAEAEAEVRRGHPNLAVECGLRHEYPAPALIDASAETGMLVLGSRGRGGFTGLLAGSTAVTLAAHGHCPVAVVRGASTDDVPPTEGSVVVGVDGSPASEAAVALAFEEASLRGAPLIAAHTWTDYTSDVDYAMARMALIDMDQVETEQEAMLAERLAGWQEKYPDVAVQRVIARDHPAHFLLEQATAAQLLVVGSRGRGGFTGLLLGSTSQALIHHAACPLLIARPDAAS